jgi:HEAT repeat protein
LETLRGVAERAAKGGPDERERISSQLAASYRQEPDSIVREEIVRAAGACRTQTSNSVLAAALNDSIPDVRIAACEGWSQVGGPDASRQLAGTLSSDVDFDVRLAAAKALGTTGDPTAVAVLGSALEDRDPAMQFQAVQSLRELTGKDLGNDVNRWRQYVNRELPDGDHSVSIAERLRAQF